MTDQPSGTADTLQRLVHTEAAMWRSLWRWMVRRRHDQPATDLFSYTGAIMGLLITFIVVVAIEIPVVHFLTRAWPIPQTIALVFGVYGLLWMFALLASLRQNPHSLDDRNVVLRFGASFRATVPLDSIGQLRVHHRSLADGKDIQTVDGPTGRQLHVAVAKQTNVDIELRDLVRVTMPDGQTEEVNSLSLYADHPHALLDAVNEARPR